MRRIKYFFIFVYYCLFKWSRVNVYCIASDAFDVGDLLATSSDSYTSKVIWRRKYKDYFKIYTIYTKNELPNHQR